MSTVRGLKCRECHRPFPPLPVAGCDVCFGPLEIDYDYDIIKSFLTRSRIEHRPRTMWRYAELLPLDGEPTVGLNTGCTPLVHARNLGRTIGLRHLYLKNDGVNAPTLSFKDRVSAVAINKALEFGFRGVGCASTGNLANSVAANAAIAKLPACILIPHDLEPAKVIGTTVYGAQVIGVKGTYDDVNRLCILIAERYPFGFVNVNLRPYYAEGSKTYAYEIAEDLGWRAPDAIVVPMAGGSLIGRIHRGFEELKQLDLVAPGPTRVFGAQAEGCSPIVQAVRDGTRDVRPVRPNTVAKSLAIGNPADGYHAADVIRRSGGWGESVSDSELIEAIVLLAETEGLFTETAGGVALGVTRKLVAQGRIHPDEVVVVALTGNGLKTQDVVPLRAPPIIAPRLGDFEALREIAGLLAPAAA